jgi:hypothetical protein
VGPNVRFAELIEQKVLWERWYSRRFSRRDQGALSVNERRLLEMDPNELLDPKLLAYMRRQMNE